MQSNRVQISFLALVVALISITSVSQAQDAPRKLAPGVLKTIEVELDAHDMRSLPMMLPGLSPVKYQPKTLPVEKTLHGQAHRVILFREYVWEYEFSLIGLRQAKIRVPSADGKLVAKNFWYIIYRIRDTGKTMTYDKVKQNPAFDHIKHKLVYGNSVKDKIKFHPQFTLNGWVDSGNKLSPVEYKSVINPVAAYQIQQIEDPNQRLLDTQQMSEAVIPMAKTETDPGVWGVAIFEDVNPEIDFVSIYVKGLTNAFRLNRKKPDEPAKMKTLQLNFWRPGDVVAERRDDVIYGIPLVDRPAEQIEICKRYRLPGPVIKVFEQDQLAEQLVKVAEVDANVNLDTLKSSLTPTLDTGSIPAPLMEDLERSGLKIDQNTTLTTVIEGLKWKFTDNGRDFIVKLEPKVWEPSFGEIRFINTLDHLWIYR